MAKETWLEKRARLKREKQAAEARARANRDLANIRKAEDDRVKRANADEVARKRREREQRQRNQGK